MAGFRAGTVTYQEPAIMGNRVVEGAIGALWNAIIQELEYQLVTTARRIAATESYPVADARARKCIASISSKRSSNATSALSKKCAAASNPAHGAPGWVGRVHTQGPLYHDASTAQRTRCVVGSSQHAPGVRTKKPIVNTLDELAFASGAALRHGNRVDGSPVFVLSLGEHSALY